MFKSRFPHVHRQRAIYEKETFESLRDTRQAWPITPLAVREVREAVRGRGTLSNWGRRGREGPYIWGMRRGELTGEAWGSKCWGGLREGTTVGGGGGRGGSQLGSRVEAERGRLVEQKCTSHAEK